MEQRNNPHEQVMRCLTNMSLIAATKRSNDEKRAEKRVKKKAKALSDDELKRDIIRKNIRFLFSLNPINEFDVNVLNQIESGLDNAETRHLNVINKLLKKKTSWPNLRARKSTIAYEILKDQNSVLAPDVAVFTNEHFKEKIKIFGLKQDSGTKNNYLCAYSDRGGIGSGGVGDHMFEIRGYYNDSGKDVNNATFQYGLDNPWNLLPITSAMNNKYKTFKIFGDDRTYDIIQDVLFPFDIQGKEKDDKYAEMIKAMEKDNEYARPGMNKKIMYENIKKWHKYCIDNGGAWSAQPSAAFKTWIENEMDIFFVEYQKNIIARSVDAGIRLFSKNDKSILLDLDPGQTDDECFLAVLQDGTIGLAPPCRTDDAEADAQTVMRLKKMEKYKHFQT